MLDPAKKQIAQAVFVVGYKRDATIRTKQFEIERALQPLISQPTINTNLADDANPQAPRVVVQTENMLVHFSQVAAQLTIAVDNQAGKPLSVIQESIAKKVTLFQSCVDRVVPLEQQAERGFVLTLNYPIDSTKYSGSDCHAYLHDRFLKVPSYGAPASANISVGYHTVDNLFMTLSVGQYEIRQVQSQVQPFQQKLVIDVNSLPVMESGIELKVDVNSRPMLDSSNQPSNVTELLLTKAFEFSSLQANSFIGI